VSAAVTALVMSSAAGSPAPGPLRTDIEAAVAVAGQHHLTALVLQASDLRDGVGAASATGTGWIWLLDEGVEPGSDTLGALLRFAQDPGGLPSPLILSSKVLDAAGRLDHRSQPQHEFRDHEAALDACGHRVMAIRAAHSGSVLIRADVVARFGLPGRGVPAHWGLFTWTARILRASSSPGYLVPGSVAQRAGAPAPRPAEYRSRLRMLAGRTWSPDEWRREAYVLAVDVMGAPQRARRA